MRTIEQLSEELEKVDKVLKEIQTKKIVLLEELQAIFEQAEELSNKYMVH